MQLIRTSILSCFRTFWKFHLQSSEWCQFTFHEWDLEGRFSKLRLYGFVCTHILDMLDCVFTTDIFSSSDVIYFPLANPYDFQFSSDRNYCQSFLETSWLFSDGEVWTIIYHWHWYQLLLTNFELRIYRDSLIISSLVHFLESNLFLVCSGWEVTGTSFSYHSLWCASRSGCRDMNCVTWQSKFEVCLIHCSFPPYA